MYSRQSVVSDGTLTRIVLGIDFFRTSDIQVASQGNILVEGINYVWDGKIAINFTTPIQNGVEVILQRKTDISKLIHQYMPGSPFDFKQLDESFKQSLFISQEYSETGTFSDLYTDLDMHRYKIMNLGAPINPGDSVNLEYFNSRNVDVLDYVIRAESAANNATASATQAEIHAVRAEAAEDSAKTYATEAESWANKSRDWANQAVIDIAAVDVRVTKTESDISALTTQVVNNSLDISTNTNNIAANTSNITAHNDRITGLQNQVKLYEISLEEFSNISKNSVKLLNSDNINTDGYLWHSKLQFNSIYGDNVVGALRDISNGNLGPAMIEGNFKTGVRVRPSDGALQFIKPNTPINQGAAITYDGDIFGFAYENIFGDDSLSQGLFNMYNDMGYMWDALNSFLGDGDFASYAIPATGQEVTITTSLDLPGRLIYIIVDQDNIQYDEGVVLPSIGGRKVVLSRRWAGGTMQLIYGIVGTLNDSNKITIGFNTPGDVSTAVKMLRIPFAVDFFKTSKKRKKKNTYNAKADTQIKTDNTEG
jgi:hypothetical protein